MTVEFIPAPDAELAEEEHLDALDPLRHLREDEDAADDQDGMPLAPAQPRNPCGLQTFDFGGSVSVALAVDAAPGCGGLAWPAGEVLSAYIVHRGPDALAGKRVLELGSGTGLVGLAAAKLAAPGAQITVTDQAPLLDTMARNVALNGQEHAVAVAELNWGEQLPTVIGKADLILAADCVYFEPAFPLLVRTLCDLVADQETEVLFCYKKRRKADKRFFTLLKAHFTWSEVDDDPRRSEYSREAISLLRLHRRNVQ